MAKMLGGMVGAVSQGHSNGGSLQPNQMLKVEGVWQQWVSVNLCTVFYCIAERRVNYYTR